MERQKENEETPAHVLAWQDETAHLGRGSWFQQEVPMHVDVCYFHEGVHYPGEHCPHEDEEYPPGWTV